MLVGTDVRPARFCCRFTYVLTLSARDSRESGSLSATSKATITVTDVNEAPVFTNTERYVDENVVRGTAVGSPVTGADPENDELWYNIIGGNSAGMFSIGATTGQIKFDSRDQPLDFEGTREYSLEVQARDPQYHIATAVVKIYVEDVNDSPKFAQATASVSVPEDATTSPEVKVAEVTATDQDGDKLTYSIVDGNSAGKFAIDSQTGKVTVAGSLDYEPVNGRQYTITVEADDGVGGTAETILNIGVTDVNEPPIMSDAAITIPESTQAGSIVTALSATDPDAGDSVTYRIVDGNVGDRFAVAQTSGMVTLTSTVDYETRNLYSLTVDAVDKSGRSTSRTLTVTVTDVNEPPSLAPQTRSVAESALPDDNGVPVEIGDPVQVVDPDFGASHTITIVGGNSAGFFEFEGSQLQLTKGGLDYDAGVRRFDLTLSIVDNGGLQASAQLTVNVLDVNEPPTVLDASLTVQENSPVNFKIGAPLTASDPDEGQLITFKITEGDDDEVFKINACDGQIQVNRAVLDFERGTKVYSLTVQAQDDAPAVPGPARLTDTATVTITVLNVNEAAVVTEDTFTVDENSAATTVVGTVAIYDDDIGQAHTYSIIDGNAGTAFEITAAGVIRVRADVLNFEVRPQYVLKVKVVDNGSPTQQGIGEIRVDVRDVNEAPVFAATTYVPCWTGRGSLAVVACDCEHVCVCVCVHRLAFCLCPLVADVVSPRTRTPTRSSETCLWRRMSTVGRP